MRKLKFRAWDGKNMVTIGWCMRPESGEIIKESFFYNQEADLIPMQFTGLKDKNGKNEIYEGDIVPIIVEYFDKTFLPEKVKEWVRMPKGDIVVKVECGESLWFDSEGLHPKSKLIIGEMTDNTMENKELLEGE